MPDTDTPDAGDTPTRAPTAPRRRYSTPRLTRQVRADVIAVVERGGGPGAAAGAAGVHPGTFRRWLARGRAALDMLDEGIDVGKDETPYVLLVLDTDGAASRARATAEVRVWRDNPLAWLRSGPGRRHHHDPGDDGWVPMNTAAIVNADAATSSRDGGPVEVVYVDDWRTGG